MSTSKSLEEQLGPVKALLHKKEDEFLSKLRNPPAEPETVSPPEGDSTPPPESQPASTSAPEAKTNPTENEQVRQLAPAYDGPDRRKSNENKKKKEGEEKEAKLPMAEGIGNMFPVTWDKLSSEHQEVIIDHLLKYYKYQTGTMRLTTVHSILDILLKCGALFTTAFAIRAGINSLTEKTQY